MSRRACVLATHVYAVCGGDCAKVGVCMKRWVMFVGMSIISVILTVIARLWVGI